MENLIKAVHAVMEECKGIDKSMQVGSGSSSYKGVSDKDVKLLIGGSMRKHGLAIFPVDIIPKSQIDRWETTDYNGKPTTKQSVFTEVVTYYDIVHASGERQRIVGYGHGTDPQDKAAGKATTYALKYTLLYTFLVATGHIDDADTVHSNDIETPSKPVKQAPKELPELTDAQFKAMLEAINKGQSDLVSKKLSGYKIDQTRLTQLNNLLKLSNG